MPIYTLSVLVHTRAKPAPCSRKAARWRAVCGESIGGGRATLGDSCFILGFYGPCLLLRYFFQRLKFAAQVAVVFIFRYAGRVPPQGGWSNRVVKILQDLRITENLAIRLNETLKMNSLAPNACRRFAYLKIIGLTLHTIMSTSFMWRFCRAFNDLGVANYQTSAVPACDTIPGCPACQYSVCSVCSTRSARSTCFIISSHALGRPRNIRWNILFLLHRLKRL